MTKKKDHPLVHLRLESNEAMQMKRDILQLEMGIIRTLQIINRYRNKRAKSYDYKNQIYDYIKQTHSDLNKLKRFSFPKINKTKILKQIEEKYNGHEEEIKKLEEKTKEAGKKEKEKLKQRYEKEKELRPKTIKEKLKSTIQSTSKDSSKSKTGKDERLQDELRSIQDQLRRLEAS